MISKKDRERIILNLVKELDVYKDYEKSFLELKDLLRNTIFDSLTEDDKYVLNNFPDIIRSLPEGNFRLTYDETIFGDLPERNIFNIHNWGEGKDQDFVTSNLIYGKYLLLSLGLRTEIIPRVFSDFSDLYTFSKDICNKSIEIYKRTIELENKLTEILIKVDKLISLHNINISYLKENFKELYNIYKKK